MRESVKHLRRQGPFSSTHYVPGAAANAFYVLTHFILSTTPGDGPILQMRKLSTTS